MVANLIQWHTSFRSVFFYSPPLNSWWVVPRGQLKHPSEYFFIPFFNFLSFSLPTIFKWFSSPPPFLVFFLYFRKEGGGSDSCTRRLKHFLLNLLPCLSVEPVWGFLLASFYFSKVVFSFNCFFLPTFFLSLTPWTDCLTHLRHSRADLQGLGPP